MTLLEASIEWNNLAYVVRNGGLSYPDVHERFHKLVTRFKNAIESKEITYEMFELLTSVGVRGK